jgi:hypothetical protein
MAKKASKRARVPKGKGRLIKLKVGPGGVAVLPWREAWAEAGEPWVEWAELAWGRRDPQRVTTPIDKRISPVELWLRFRAKPRVAAARRVRASRGKPKRRG